MDLKDWKEHRDYLVELLQVALKWGHRDCAKVVAGDIVAHMGVDVTPEQESKTIGAACCHYKNGRRN